MAIINKELEVTALCSDHYTQVNFLLYCTGVRSMGALGAGEPMKSLSGTHTKAHFALKYFYLCYRFSVHVHIGIRAPVYQIVFLYLCIT